jgi:hypothetical protein
MAKKKNDTNGTDKPTDNGVVANAPTNGNHTDRLIPIKAWPDYHPWPPEGGLRHIRFWAEEKGAADCFVKKGSRVLVREQAFLKWASTTDAG